MAKSTHLKRLLEGREVWNEWMDSDESREPDLRAVDLEGADLSDYHLTNANLEGANLHNCNLSSARLGSVNLEKADLTEADLLMAQFYKCNLNQTNLEDSRLESTYFQHCKLNKARLSGAYAPRAYFLRGSLEGASFDETMIAQTTFAGIDLSGVESLASVEHAGQSTIGLDTLLSSDGNISDEFIRGCGYDPLIQQVLTGDRASHTDAFYKRVEEGSPAFRLQSCFISYSTRDKVFADSLRSALNEHGVDYWYAPIHGQWGAELTPQIDREIQLRDRVMLICSKSSLSEGRRLAALIFFVGSSRTFDSWALVTASWTWRVACGNPGPSTLQIISPPLSGNMPRRRSIFKIPGDLERHIQVAFVFTVSRCLHEMPHMKTKSATNTR